MFWGWAPEPPWIVSQTMLFHVVAAMAEFERDLIAERTREGLKAAKARGKLGGRKPFCSPEQARQARRMHADGELTAEEIGRVLGVSRAIVLVVYRGLPVMLRRALQQVAQAAKLDHDTQVVTLFHDEARDVLGRRGPGVMSPIGHVPLVVADP